MAPWEVEQWLSVTGGLTNCRVRGPLAVRDNSRLYYAECSGLPGPAAVKACVRPLTSEADCAAASRQYASLRRVHSAMGEHAELSVPRPYVLVERAGLLGTEWVTGRSMTALLFSWRCGPAQAQDLVIRAARWLRHFHECHALAPGRLDVGDKLAFLSTLQVNERFRRTLERSAGAAEAVPLARSWVHGDFTADNLMVAGDRTLGIDIDARHENTVVHDLAPFLNYLELRAFHPGGCRRWASLTALRRSFLENYFGHPADAIAVPLAWLRLYLVLQGWNTATGKSPSRVRRAFNDLSYGTVAARLAKVLDAG